MAELDGTTPERGVLLALEALENYPYTPQAESALAKAVENGVSYFDFEAHLTTMPPGWWNKGIWSPNGQRFAAALQGQLGSLGVVWDTATHEPISMLKSPSETNTYGCGMIDLAWAPSNDQLITLSTVWNDRCLEAQPPSIWNAATGTVVRSFDVYTDAISVDWSSDGQSIAIGDAQGTAKIWTAADGALRLTLKGHTGRVNDVAFSPKGDRVATASADGTAIVWNVASGQVITTLAGHAGSVTGVSWSPDGLRLATSSKDGLGRI